MLSLFFASALHFLVARDVAYGTDPAQRFDVYAPRGARNAPVLVMVHGGGWRIGDKAVRNVVENKVAHWVGNGWILISVNNRLLPTPPVEQAQDVARAIAYAQQHAREWGGDPHRFVLMGHSAGAHLVALVTTSNPPVLGSVLLDSAALDVPRIMDGPHFRLYDDAFGRDRSAWRAASPWHQLHAQTPPILAVCSSRRRESCSQAEAFVAKARSLGTRASVLPESLSHEQINETLGEPGDYTAAVDRFLATLR
jgi:arylformamidase